MQKILQDYTLTVIPASGEFCLSYAASARASMAGCLHARTPNKPSERAASPGLCRAPAEPHAALLTACAVR